MEINDRNDEEHRVEQSRESARKEDQRRQKTQPMRTFEAKLSERALHEASVKDSQTMQMRQQMKDSRDRREVFAKVIGSTKSEKEGLLDHLRAQAVSQEVEKEAHDGESRREEVVAEHRREAARDDSDSDSSLFGDAKKSDTAEDGHRRVAEKRFGGESNEQSGGGFEGGDAETSSEGGSSFSGKQGGSGGGEKRESGTGIFAKNMKAVAAVKKAGGEGGPPRGFQQQSRPFTQQNLDDIVRKVELGVTEGGDDFFSVELSDRYFDGLKVKAVRTDRGVVLKFLCPNIAVRSTFIRYRPVLYSQLKSKNISVFRIDVV